MTWEIAFTLAVIFVAIVTLIKLRVGPDIVLFGGLTLLLAVGILKPEDALAGFSNSGLMTVAVLFVVAEGLRQTGGANFIGQKMLGQPKSLLAAQTRVMLPSAVLSGFMNNTPVVAMMLPIVKDWSKKYRISVSHVMLPLSYAAILGGLVTLVGTSTTLVVNGLVKQLDIHGQPYLGAASEIPAHPGLGMFEIAWVGLPAAAIGLIYMLVTARWLLPERKPAITDLDDPRSYTVEMIVDPTSPLVGNTIEDAGLRHLPSMYLMEIDRDGHILAAVASDERLQKNDRLIFVGIVESIVDLQKIPGLKPATDQMFKLDSPRRERCLIEAVVSNSCPLIRTTIREARFRSRYNAAVIAVARNGERIKKKIGDIRLQAGDTLLLEAHSSFEEVHRNSRDFFLVSRVEDSSPPRHERAWISRIILAVMIVVVATEMLSMLKAAMLAACLMVGTRCCRASEAKRSIDWGVLLTIGAGLGLGKAMETSGAANYLAGSLIGFVGDSPILVLAVIYGITMVFTNIITAKAAAVLIFPIAIASAESLGVNFMPFVVAVMIASAASFATPIGYQTNLMVFGPGGYRFSDYARIGVPLSLILWALTVFLAPRHWMF